MPKKLSYDFIKKQFENEGYSLLSDSYTNANTKLKVKCSKGHEYEVKYGHFYSGKRCPECQHPNKKHSYEYIKELIEKEGYQLLSKEYKNNRQKLLIKCNEGHKFELSWHKFVTGTRCLVCAGNQKLTYQFVKEQIEKEGYELLSEKYKNARDHIKVKCSKGHEYITTYDRACLGQKKGCPKCSSSKQEKEIVEYLKSLNLEVIENDRKLIKPLELDIIIPSHKLAIEYCGLYWHSELYKDKNYHLKKLNKTNKKCYRLLTIFEDEWLNKQEIVKSRLKYILGLEQNKIYARKCIIKEITTNEARNFINKYHIQGYNNSSICIGAFYNNKLVAVNTFIKRYNNYELNRFCLSTPVVGIASKLLKYFQRNYDHEKITTFADRRWSDGNLYKTIGFTEYKKLYPDYSYFKNVYRFHKFGFRHKQMKNKLDNYIPNLSEHENMLNNGWNRIYDCGKIRYDI